MSITVISITVGLLIVFIAISLWMRYRWFLYCGHKRRDIPVTPLRFARSLYSLLLFTFMVYGIALPFTLIIYIIYWNRQKRLHVFHLFLQLSSKIILKLLPEIDFTFNNEIGETFDNSAVIICNHQGHFDLLCIMMMTPRLVVLTNERVWHNPLYGWIIHLAEFYPVTNGLDYNIPKLQSLIDRGYSVVVFPEGTRSADCRILRFHTGAFYLAEKLKVDILPVILHGVGHCIPKEDFMMRPGHMYLEVMNRIKFNRDDSDLYMRDLSKQVRSLYIKHYQVICDNRETASYFAKYVQNKYRYMPNVSYRHIKNLLKNNNNYSITVDYNFKSGSVIIVNDTSFGMLSWLLALVHPDCKIIAYIDSTESLDIAKNTPSIPDRLIFTDNNDLTGNYLITMRSNGSVDKIKNNDLT